MFRANPYLVKQQNLSDEALNDLGLLHIEKEELFEEFVVASKEDYPRLVLELEDIEFMMQKVWKFKEDRNYHTWWCEVPNCSCSNTEQKFGGEKVFDEDCEIHSK